MSSQVNKSKGRFKPRAGKRVRLNSTTRRGSTASGAPQFSASDLAKASESAVFDEDFKAPGLPIAQGESASEATRDTVVVDVTTAAGDQAPAPTPDTQSQAQTQPDQPPLSKGSAPVATGLATPAPTAEVSIPAAPVAPAAPAVPAVPEPVAPPKTARVNPKFDLEDSEPDQDESLYVNPGKIGGVPQPVKPIGAALIVDEDSDSDREVQYDEKGKAIVEPKDVARFGRTNAKMHFPERVINPEAFTMADMCNDLPVGEINKDYFGFEAGRSERKRMRTQLLLAKRMVRGKYHPKRESKRFELLRLYKDWQEARASKFGGDGSGSTLDNIDNEDWAPPSATQALSVQLDEDGKIILDERTTQVDRHQNNKVDSVDPKNVKDVDDKYKKVINSASHRNKERPERWTEEETAVFYDLLSAWGTDFNLISQFFPQRNRTQIKTKFKYEEKRNPQKVQMYLVHRKKVSLKDIARVSGKPIVDLRDIEADLEAVRKEHAAQLEKETQARADAEKEDAARKAELHQRKHQKKGITGTAEVVGEVQKKEEEAAEDLGFDDEDEDDD